MPRTPSVLAVLAALVLTGCGAPSAVAPDAVHPGIPELAAPQGEGLVGEAPGALELVPPVHPPAGAGVPTPGSCLAPIADVPSYLNSGALGDLVDCASGHGGVVVGVEGFTAEDLAADPTGAGIETVGTSFSRPTMFQLTALATPRCRAQLDAVQEHALAMGEGISRAWALRPAVVMPLGGDWVRGEHWAACVLLAPSGRTIPGDVDPFALSADQPLPPSLQECFSSIGSPTPCTSGAASQHFLTLHLPEDQVVPEDGPLPDDVEGELQGRCYSALAWLDRDLAEADWSGVGAQGWADQLDRSVATGSDVVDARCVLQNRNFGAGVREFLP